MNDDTTSDDPMALRHGTVTANRIRLHYVEQGTGPMVLFVHGFPESWYSWRHQLPAVAAAGYRAVAIDVRGYGRSAKPAAVDEYRMLCHVADNVALVRALDESSAVIVGHDWGAPIAWTSAQLRPDVFSAVVGISVPFGPSGPTRPSDAFRAIGGDEEFYIEYFQQPGRAEAEIEEDIRGWLLGTYFSAAGEGVRATDGSGFGTIAPGGTMRERFVYPDTMPDWLTDADLDVYTAEFERSGFTGPLNRYRNVDRDWEDLAAFGDVPIRVPAMFLAGELDGPAIWGARNIERFDRTLPELRDTRFFDGCGHWVQQERPEETNRALLDFLHTR